MMYTAPSIGLATLALISLLGGCYEGTPDGVESQAPLEGEGEGEGEGDGGIGVGSDSGIQEPQSMPAACNDLVAKTCGDGSCAEDPGCVSAQLLVEFAQYDRCDPALNNDASYPRCGASPCDQLVEKVCGGLTSGGERRCEEGVGCAPARYLAARRNDGVTDLHAAEDDCTAALSDGALFPACAPPP